jgi:hypothetical protein
MTLFLFFKKRPKLLVLSTLSLVLVAFTAAYSKTRPLSYHSGKELNEYRMMQAGDLPTTVGTLFIGSGKCAGCHGIDPVGIANVTAEGEMVSPAENWRATMMANSSKDPFWRAKVAHEVSINPEHEEELVNKCTSCHAPLGKYGALHDGIDNFTMAMLDEDSLANDGVSCTACHMQNIQTIGQQFSGELHFSEDTIFGPQFNIADDELPLFVPAMTSFVGVTPVPDVRFSNSETCAGCHTLITNTVDLQGNSTGTKFIEQATYHEWLNSSYNMDETLSQECQGCHMPRLNEPIVVASGYLFLEDYPRTPFGQHWLVGGNSFMLKLMKNRINQLGITATEGNFDTVISRTLQNLQQNTSMIELSENAVDGDTARYTVKITNKVGHKFPSGYPARRAFIEFLVTDDEGNEVFHSGKLDNTWEVQGQNADWEPHYDLITDDANQVQIYEMVMSDVDGGVTTVLERADHMIKDNRLVPLGFKLDHPVYDSTMIVGTALNDPNFNYVGGVEGSGTDEIRYHVPVTGLNGNLHVSVKLWYQSDPPKWNNELFSVDNPVINAYEQMYWEEGGDEPVQVAMAETNTTVIGVSEFAKFFKVGPNPTSSGMVNIYAGKDQILEINVYSMDGKLIETLNPRASNSQITLPRTQGTYLLDVRTNRGRRIEKVLRR